VSSEGDRRGETSVHWLDAGEQRPLTSVSTRQQPIAEMAQKYTGSPLRTLSHHLDLLWMREAYGRVRRDSAPDALADPIVLGSFAMSRQGQPDRL
jgi:hypothetical protein